MIIKKINTQKKHQDQPNFDSRKRRNSEQMTDKQTHSTKRLRQDANNPKEVMRKERKETEKQPKEKESVSKQFSTTLYITGFLRPFRIEQVKELLSKSGTIVNFWMDEIKSRCHVTFETKEQAVATREEIHNLVWPIHNGRALRAEFSSVEELKRVQKKTSLNVRPLQKNEPKEHLDTLFKKTITEPKLYYLPLSDEEVQQQKKQREKEISINCHLSTKINNSNRSSSNDRKK